LLLSVETGVSVEGGPHLWVDLVVQLQIRLDVVFRHMTSCSPVYRKCVTTVLPSADLRKVTPPRVTIYFLRIIALKLEASFQGNSICVAVVETAAQTKNLSHPEKSLYHFVMTESLTNVLEMAFP
jgi:hypothetical protein